MAWIVAEWVYCNSKTLLRSQEHQWTGLYVLNGVLHVSGQRILSLFVEWHLDDLHTSILSPRLSYLLQPHNIWTQVPIFHVQYIVWYDQSNSSSTVAKITNRTKSAGGHNTMTISCRRAGQRSNELQVRPFSEWSGFWSRPVAQTGHPTGLLGAMWNILPTDVRNVKHQAQ